jgi:uncharacterized protein
MFKTPESTYHRAGQLFPYDLRSGTSQSRSFYYHLDHFTSKVITDGMKRFEGIIHQYRKSEVFRSEEFSQSSEENLLDILMIGTFWNEFKGKWGNSIGFQYMILRSLYHIRIKYPGRKPTIDRIRGRLGYLFLANPSNREVSMNLLNLEFLILYLSATGDYNEEVKRLQLWHRFLNAIPEILSKALLKEASAYAEWFKKEAIIELGQYTRGVDSFLDNHEESYRGREDYFFCGRNEIMYHLNMVGAAIMNRSLKDDFEQTTDQVLMLPTCMVKSDKCKAVQFNSYYVCTHCTPGCNASAITRKMKAEGKQTVLIKHSSDFSKALLPWANQNETGLIGTACVLNLLAGGFEMKRMGIPSQCVFLDYCSCKKHWHSEGIPTSINVSQIEEILPQTLKGRMCS